MTHVAVDIGASGGRLIISDIINDKLDIKEIHRFPNNFKTENGTLCWDIDQLFNEILKGLQQVKRLGYEKCTVGIDTWAVDYVLTNKEGIRIKEVVSYRDKRTENTIDKVTKSTSKESIYSKTGIQFLPFNTLYQLYEEDHKALQQTEQLLLVPDYLNYRLTGRYAMEATNASTTQLLDVGQRKLDEELLQLIGLDSNQFAKLTEPGNVLGVLRNEWFSEYDLPQCQVINIASHDTASAVAGTPSVVDNWAYLSSGTWSLIGIESKTPVINDLSFKGNYTNEWGACNTYRFLKNIMGMWIIQKVREELPGNYEFNDLVQLAEKVKPFQQYIDFNDERFLHPKNMIREIQLYCEETNQKVPKTPSELAASAFHNLAIIYSIALDEMEQITNKKIEQLYIVGGGGRNELLNQLTADLSNKTVFVGPSEATAIGNILMQLITVGKIDNLAEGRKMVANSFGVTKYPPNDINRETVIDEFKKTTKVEKI